MTIKIITEAGSIKCNSKLQILLSFIKGSWRWLQIGKCSIFLARWAVLFIDLLKNLLKIETLTILCTVAVCGYLLILLPFLRGWLLLRGYAASHHSELSLGPCDVAVSGVGWAANRCTAYHANVEAGNLCPRALGVNNYSCKKCYMNANIFTEQEVCSENRLTNFHIINLNFYPQKSVELNQYWILFGI